MPNNRLSPYRQYIIDYIRKIYAIPDDITIGNQQSSAMIRIPDLAGNFFDNEALLKPDNIVWKDWRDQSIPVLFPGNDLPWYRREKQSIVLNDDLLASAFYLLSGWQENHFFRHHHALRYPFEQSLQNVLGFTHLPVVSYYCDIIKSAAEAITGGTFDPPRWHDTPFAICLTHDIDHIRTGWAADALSEIRRKKPLSALKIVLRRIAGRSDAFNLRNISALESKYGATSSFYFIPHRGKTLLRKGRAQPQLKKAGDPPATASYFFRNSRLPFAGDRQHRLENADYDISEPKLMKAIRSLNDAGNETGLHGHFGSPFDSESLHQATGNMPWNPLGGRFHYLHFDPLRTFDYLDAAGLKYDTTLGFAEQPGFRHGVAWPFFPYDFKLQRARPVLEIPLIAMDTSYRSYLGQRPEQAKPGLQQLFRETEKFGGCLTILWHNNYFTGYKFAGWGELYQELLKEGKNRGAWMTSAANIYHYWTAR